MKKKRLDELKKGGKIKQIESSKPLKSARFVLTKVGPYISAEDVEVYLLENFDELESVFVRKNDMTHSKYASFVFFIKSGE